MVWSALNGPRSDGVPSSPSTWIVTGIVAFLLGACGEANPPTHADEIDTDHDLSADMPDTSHELMDTGSDTASDTVECCPIDEEPSGCMFMGGDKWSEDACELTCDFWCSTNWRVEVSASGCPGWDYDMREPREGEDEDCLFMESDATPSDAASAGDTMDTGDVGPD